MAGRLYGKRIVITGAIGNIGKAAVRSFVAEGAQVVIGDIDEATGQAAAQELGAAVSFIRVDVTSEKSVAALIDQAAATLGGLDALVQNAGVQYSAPVTAFEQAHWDKLFAVNARAQFFGAKYAVPHLRKAGKGAIVNTSSLAGKRGGPGLTAYSASKGAVISFTTALALELAPDISVPTRSALVGSTQRSTSQPSISWAATRRSAQLSRRSSRLAGRQRWKRSRRSSFISSLTNPPT